MLKGDTVTYAAWNSIKDTLDYDFATEKQYSYEGLSVERCVKHLAKFASNIWQIHPFCEGNTRAMAVFIIKYMKTLQKIMGHSDIGVTLNTYTHMDFDDVQKEMKEVCNR